MRRVPLNNIAAVGTPLLLPSENMRATYHMESNAGTGKRFSKTGEGRSIAFDSRREAARAAIRYTQTSFAG
jgi:hypothetical protein